MVFARKEMTRPPPPPPPPSSCKCSCALFNTENKRRQPTEEEEDMKWRRTTGMWWWWWWCYYLEMGERERERGAKVLSKSGIEFSSLKIFSNRQQRICTTTTQNHCQKRRAQKVFRDLINVNTQVDCLRVCLNRVKGIETCATFSF